MPVLPHPNRLLFSLGLLSLSMIAYQLSLMQYLSIVQWYHFAYMIIGIALLGFGAAGTFIAIFRKRLLQKTEIFLPGFMLLTAVFMPLSIWLSAQPFARFDTYLLFVEQRELWRLLFFELLFFIPFFFCALAIGLAFVKYTSGIGSLYFSNLAGSGLGGLAAIILFWTATPIQIPFLTALLSLIAALLILPLRWKGTWMVSSGLAVLFLFFSYSSPLTLPLSQYKSLSRTLDLPETNVEQEVNSPYGWVQYVSSPYLRYAPGLSLGFTGKVPLVDAVFNNGEWAGALLRSAEESEILDYTTSAIAWKLTSPQKILILNAGTGIRTQYALTHEASSIDHVESNPVVTDLAVRETDLQTEASVDFHSQDARSFLAHTNEKYDVISFPELGAFGGSAGLQAVQEEYLLTKNAFSEAYGRLQENGLMEIKVWMDYPYRNPLKVAATLAEVLEEKGISEPESRLLAIRSWNTISFLLKRSAFSETEIKAVREFCEDLNFDPLIMPHITTEERSRYNLLEDESLFRLIDTLLSKDREQVYENYDFHLRPATDDKPYFSQFLRLKSFPQLRQLYGEQSASFFELGYLIVGVTFIQSLILAVTLIILPLFWLKGTLKNRSRTFLYFSGLGIGYMFVEIVFIQRFILYLGHPVYSVAAVISGMLLLSGLGSRFSSRLNLSLKAIGRLVILIVFLLLLYILSLPWLLEMSMGLPLWMKTGISLVLIGIPAFFMGMPFPLGLQHLSKNNEAGVPWAWGVNGCLSVVSASLATILAIETGFSILLLLGGVAYMMTAGSCWIRSGNG